MENGEKTLGEIFREEKKRADLRKDPQTAKARDLLTENAEELGEIIEEMQAQLLKFGKYKPKQFDLPVSITMIDLLMREEWEELINACERHDTSIGYTTSDNKVTVIIDPAKEFSGCQALYLLPPPQKHRPD